MNSPKYGSTELTEKELRLVNLLAKGMKNLEIAEAMGTTEYVIKNYLRVIYDKLGMWNRVEVALWYVHSIERPRPRPRARAAAAGV